MTLEPDRNQIEIYFNALFRYAGSDGYLSLRAFEENDNNKFAEKLWAVRLNGKGLTHAIETAVDIARRAANNPKPVVFCPLTAVFSNGQNAREPDVSAGLELSSENDKTPQESLARLEDTIGSATAVVRSGGRLIDPHGEVQDKLHGHWRLARPARGEDLAKLKEARKLAARLVGGDPSNVPLVHPIRCPGSWHRKAEPRLCEIVRCAPDREIDLDEALAALRAAAPPESTAWNGGGGHGQSEDWEMLVRDVLDANRIYPSCPPLTMKMQRAGMKDGAVVNLTRGIVNLSAAREAEPQRWQNAYEKIPAMVRDGRKKIESEREKTPLFPPLPPAAPYPVEALGPALSAAASAIARKVQVPLAIAAQSVLGTAALVAQAHANILLPYGQTRPLSLFLVTVAMSGDRKTSADREAQWPIRRREKVLKGTYDRESKDYNIEHRAWSGEKKKIENDRRIGIEERRRLLATLGDAPLPPLSAFLTCPDPTVEGLIKAWPNAQAALGIFSTEGGQFLGGYGMGQDQALKTAAVLSDLWDGNAIKRVRALDGVSVLHGRRLSVHLMVQPSAAAEFFANSVLRDQGLLSRMLAAAPDSIAGGRFYSGTLPEDDAAIKKYGALILAVAEKPLPLDDGRNELNPRTLTLCPAADARWRQFYNEIEGDLAPEGKYRPVVDLAAKAAEHAARIAGVMALVDYPNAESVSEEEMSNAAALARWYLDEALRLQQAGRMDPELLAADALLKFLQSTGEEEIRVRDIYQRGPNGLRTMAAAERAIKVLIDHGWLVEGSPRPRTVRLCD